MNAVSDFARRFTNRGQALSERMREYAEEKMDWSVKVRQMYDFASEVCARD